MLVVYQGLKICLLFIKSLGILICHLAYIHSICCSPWNTSLWVTGAEWPVLSWLPTFMVASRLRKESGAGCVYVEHVVPLTVGPMNILRGVWKRLPKREVKLKWKKWRLRNINIKSVLWILLHKCASVVRRSGVRKHFKCLLLIPKWKVGCNYEMWKSFLLVNVPDKGMY